jgi:phage-related protein
MSFEVELTEEVIGFILSLPIKMQAKIQRSIQLLEKFGYSLPNPHSKKIISTLNLYELRIKQGSNICRLFYFHFKNKMYIITSGYIKKTNKLDKKQIEKAIKIMNNFVEEKNE